MLNINNRCSNTTKKTYRDACEAEQLTCSDCTDKKENKIFLIYKEIQKGAVATCKVIYD